MYSPPLFTCGHFLTAWEPSCMAQFLKCNLPSPSHPVCWFLPAVRTAVTWHYILYVYLQLPSFPAPPTLCSEYKVQALLNIKPKLNQYLVA